MSHIEKHRPGSFCWIELATTDQDAAKKFYGSLFGWGVNEFPMGPGEVYTIFRLQGRDAAAAYTLRPEQRSAGVPPHWMIYIAVDSADSTAKRAAEVGGKVLAPPFDVGTFGRMAVIQDPTGATFALWQPKENRGTGITGESGTLCWADLSTPDPARAGKFYSDLFGWKLTDDTDDDPPSGYVHIQNGEDFIGGIPPTTHRDPKMPAHWLAYFLVANCDASAAKAKELGANFYLQPMTMEGVGRFAVVADPQRAVFAIFQAMPRK
ncbi:MAG: VOC family protein [Acidobacteriia bacterium]|nr:VOC family protein [Terriglobia bacterium]